VVRKLFRDIGVALHHRRHPSFARTERFVWGLIAFSIVVLVVELVWSERGESPAWLLIVDNVLVWIFVVELALRVITFRPQRLDVFDGPLSWRVRTHILGRLRFLLRPMSMIDVLAVLAVVPALRALRVLRLLRLARGIHLFQYSTPLRSVLRSFQENGLLYVFSVGFLVTSITIGGVSLYLIEGGTNPSINSLGDGLWWAIVTISTVGFGDITPSTSMGRVVGSAVMFCGMFSIALFAGTVGSTILRVLMTLREDQFRMSTYSNHIVVCGYDPSTELLLDALQSELRGERGQIVVFSPGDRPADLRPDYAWISGEPGRESELDKVHLHAARAVAVTSPRNMAPQHADACTLMAIFTIRSYLRRHEDAAVRKRPLYVVAEIVEPENVDHAKAAGADEVIETMRLGYALMAHATLVHGSAAIMSSVASFGAQSLFIEPNPLEATRTFGEVASYMRRTHHIATIGLRDAQGGEMRINPDDAELVRPGQDIVYLSDKPMKFDAASTDDEG